MGVLHLFSIILIPSYTPTHMHTQTYRHLSLQNIPFFIILSSNTFASWDNSHLTNAAVCVQNTPTMSHPEKVGKKAMHEFLYRNTYTPRKSHLKKLCALWQWYKKRLLFSEWEGTCGWCKIEALFPVHAPCWSLWRQSRNMVNLWKWLRVSGILSEVEDSERRQWVKVCFMKQCKDAHLQPGSRGSGVVPSDELSTWCHWSACPWNRMSRAEADSGN